MCRENLLLLHVSPWKVLCEWRMKCGLQLVWQRNDIFSVDGWFLGLCLCRREASRGEAGGAEEVQVSAGQEGEVGGECRRAWPREKSRFELEASGKGGWKLLAGGHLETWRNAFLGRSWKLRPLPHTSPYTSLPSGCSWLYPFIINHYFSSFKSTLCEPAYLNFISGKTNTIL